MKFTPNPKVMYKIVRLLKFLEIFQRSLRFLKIFREFSNFYFLLDFCQFEISDHFQTYQRSFEILQETWEFERFSRFSKYCLKGLDDIM